MKKLIPFFFILLAFGFAFQACDDTKTYAEMLEEEDDAIADFINKQGIKVISQTEFFDNDSVTNVDENEYVQLASGVYMQIVDKGSDNPADTIRNNEKVLVRFMEYSLLDQDTTLSNLSFPNMVDEFLYKATSSTIAGSFVKGNSMMYSWYGYEAVPAGWLVPMPYIRDRAHVRLIVPSKMGHYAAMQNVYPFYYEIEKYQFWR